MFKGNLIVRLFSRTDPCSRRQVVCCFNYYADKLENNMVQTGQCNHTRHGCLHSAGYKYSPHWSTASHVRTRVLYVRAEPTLRICIKMLTAPADRSKR